jgi:molybdenum cofactor cytidylyltransferase
MAIDCIIPAAGASTRMGGWKPLLPFGASTIVETTVEAALAAQVEGGIRVLLVAGYRGNELRDRFEGRPGVVIVDNPRWEAGMLGSIQAALPFVGSERFFILHADMPLVPSSAFEVLCEASQGCGPGAGGRAGNARGGASGSADKDAGVPLLASFRGEAGHPVLVPSTLIGEIMGLDPAGRLRPFLLERGGRLVDCGSRAVLADLDSRPDYEKALSERSIE